MLIFDVLQTLLQVRLGLVLENGRVETKKVGKHQGRVHKLAVEPGSPYILYSCGEDGFLQHVGCHVRYLVTLFSFPMLIFHDLHYFAV